MKTIKEKAYEEYVQETITNGKAGVTFVLTDDNINPIYISAGLTKEEFDSKFNHLKDKDIKYYVEKGTLHKIDYQTPFKQNIKITMTVSDGTNEVTNHIYTDTLNDLKVVGISGLEEILANSCDELENAGK
mgnify:CR=1 FL=1